MSTFNSVSSEMEEELGNIVGTDNCLTGDSINDDYAHDEMPIYGAHMPDVVVMPATTEEVSQIMVVCNQNNVPVTVRGAGTGLVGGATPLYGGVVLSTERMTDILEFDEDNLTVRVQPGVRLCDLADYADERDLLYPPDPGEKTGSIGGNISTNAGGMRAVMYGTTRDYVLAMTVVLPTGEIVELGRPVAKQSSGYNLMQLIIGSEGTLAIATEITLRLVPKPKASLSFILPFDNIVSAIESVPKIRMANLPTQSIEFMERDIVASTAQSTGSKVFPEEVNGQKPGAYILVTMIGNDQDDIFTQAETLAEIGDEFGAYDTLVLDQPSQNKAAWDARDSFLDVIKDESEFVDEMDVVVPTNKIPEFLKFACDEGERDGLRIRSFGHAGDGNLHIYCCANDMDLDEFKERAAKVMKACYEKCSQLNGQISGEHGIGHAKKQYLRQSVGDLQMTLMQGIKKVFDPKGILNPGKVCD